MTHTAADVASEAPALRCRGLVKRYADVLAVAGIDLEVPRGICFGLLGPNGAGKTTTLEMIEGLTPPTAGSIEVLGTRWGAGEDHALRRRLGVQLQETRLPDKLTVVEVLRLFRSFYPAADGRGRSVEEAIGIVQLEEKRRALVEKLSGGQKQRLSLACALVGDPHLLFLDEPTTGLDPQARLSIWEIVERFKAGGGTVLLTTHAMEEAARLCDRLAILDHGRVLVEGTPAELVASLRADQIVELTVDGEPPATDVVAALPGVSAVSVRDGKLVLSVTRMGSALPAALALLEREGVALASLTTHQPTLEDVFVSLTGRGLRDE
jgi:ABC-2 type transport system ATP-binding protein